MLKCSVGDKNSAYEIGVSDAISLVSETLISQSKGGFILFEV